MTELRYIAIHTFCEYHQVERDLVESFVDFGLLEPHREAGEWVLRADDVEPLETMLRLHRELGVNLEGIETIMHMRRRMMELQDRLRNLEYELRRRGGRL